MICERKGKTAEKTSVWFLVHSVNLYILNIFTAASHKATYHVALRQLTQKTLWCLLCCGLACVLVLVLIVCLYEEMTSEYLLRLEVKLFLITLNSNDTFGCAPS